MIVDAICAPSNIRYPRDISLLTEAGENAEKLLDALHNPEDVIAMSVLVLNLRRDQCALKQHPFHPV